jgi:hypothetical protein
MVVAYAKKIAQNVILVNGDRLSDIMIQHNVIPPHSPTPVPVLTVSDAAGAEAISLQSDSIIKSSIPCAI